MRKNLDPFNNFEDADLWGVLEEVEELNLIFSHLLLMVDVNYDIATVLYVRNLHVDS